jgi:hypothetical protein
MKKAIHVILLSCKKATELIDKKLVVGLSVKENLQLHLHTAICDSCKTYQKQSKLIDQLLVKFLSDNAESNTTRLENKELKEKIISKL